MVQVSEGLNPIIDLSHSQNDGNDVGFIRMTESFCIFPETCKFTKVLEIKKKIKVPKIYARNIYLIS